MGKKPKYNIPESELRCYISGDSCIFKKNNEEFGGLSNMSTKFPVWVNGTKYPSVETLYQCLRFTNNSRIQQEILDEKSPMSVKMISQKYKSETRSDWDVIRVKIMKWALQIKFAQNVISFGELLSQTGVKNIVENSSTDNFWGAIPNESNTTYIGKNALGRLLMDLRDKFNSKAWIDLLYIPKPGIEKLFLLEEEITDIDERNNFINSLISHWSDSKIPFECNKTDEKGLPYSNLGVEFKKKQTKLFP